MYTVEILNAIKKSLFAITGVGALTLNYEQELILYENSNSIKYLQNYIVVLKKLSEAIAIIGRKYYPK